MVTSLLKGCVQKCCHNEHNATLRLVTTDSLTPIIDSDVFSIHVYLGHLHRFCPHGSAGHLLTGLCFYWPLKGKDFLNCHLQIINTWYKPKNFQLFLQHGTNKMKTRKMKKAVSVLSSIITPVCSMVCQTGMLHQKTHPVVLLNPGKSQLFYSQ